MYSKRSRGAERKKFLMSRKMYFASAVLRTLFHINFDVVRSAVSVESSPG
jgi:hypothetical protein